MVKSTIYKISHKNPAITNCYVGRTTDASSRFQQHRICCNNPNIKAYNYKLYKTIRETGGLQNWEFLELENVEHEPKQTELAREREAFWFKQLSATLNQNVPNQDHKVSCKIWAQNNIEHSKQYRKQYYIEHREENKEMCKAYYETHKEQIRQASKAWIAKNHEYNKQYQRERYHKLKAIKLKEQEDLKNMVAADLAEKETI